MKSGGFESSIGCVNICPPTSFVLASFASSSHLVGQRKSLDSDIEAFKPSTVRRRRDRFASPT